jgi:hypothetical protein
VPLALSWVTGSKSNTGSGMIPPGVSWGSDPEEPWGSDPDEPWESDPDESWRRGRTIAAIAVPFVAVATAVARR